jgi:hypothetical protein
MGDLMPSIQRPIRLTGDNNPPRFWPNNGQTKGKGIFLQEQLIFGHWFLNLKGYALLAAGLVLPSWTFLVHMHAH